MKTTQKDKSAYRWILIILLNLSAFLIGPISFLLHTNGFVPLLPLQVFIAWQNRLFSYRLPIIISLDILLAVSSVSGEALNYFLYYTFISSDSKSQAVAQLSLFLTAFSAVLISVITLLVHHFRAKKQNTL